MITASQPLVAFATQIDNTSDDPSLQTGSFRWRDPTAHSLGHLRQPVSLISGGAEYGSSAAQVRLRQRDTNGVLRGEFVVSIPSNGFYSQDDIHASLGLSGLFGPLEITSLNSMPLVATSRVYSVNSGTSGFFEGQDVSVASSNGVVPISQDNTAFRTNLGINNLGVTAADVQVNLYEPQRSLAGNHDGECAGGRAETVGQREPHVNRRGWRVEYSRIYSPHLQPAIVGLQHVDQQCRGRSRSRDQRGIGSNAAVDSFCNEREPVPLNTHRHQSRQQLCADSAHRPQYFGRHSGSKRRVVIPRKRDLQR